jgi:hypothetical protein
MTQPTAGQDPAEQAILVEFGSYLEQVTKGFTHPIEASIRNAEDELLKRLEKHESTIRANHASDLESLNERRSELKRLSLEFTEFIKAQQQRLDAAEANFRTSIKDMIQTEMSQQVRVIKARVTITMSFAAALLVLLPLLQWFLRR